MSKKTRTGFFSDLYGRFMNDGITLDTAYDRNITTNYIDRQNAFIMTVISLLLLGVNAFWLVVSIMRKRGVIFSPISGIGLLVGMVIPLIAILYLRFGKRTGTPLRIMVILLHLSIIGSALLMNPIWRGQMPSDGVTLASFWLIACAFITMNSLFDSVLIMSVLVFSGLIPKLMFPTSPYSLAGNVIICLCTVLAYFAFRAYSFRSARLVSKLADISYLDFQTKVFNRRALYEYFGSLHESEVKNIGVMMYDIDDFKKYNDEYSHAKGDMVLARIGQTAAEFLSGEKARVFRYNGGEFVAIMEDVSEEKLLMTAIKVKEIIEELRLERNDDTMRDYVTVTVGCTLASTNECRERDVIGEADTQLYIGKRGAKNCVVFKGRIFISEGEISVAQQPTHYTDCVAKAINEAMVTKELRAFYQPMYDTETQKLVGAEALCRWVKADGTVIQPSEFIPELEKNSSILAVDWYMFEEVCKTLRKQKKLGIPQVRISVNFSRMHVLYEHSIEQRLCEIADAYGIPHELIEIEITESAYIHLPNIVEPFVRNIRSRGFAVAVDDFGSGASSLEFIKTIDVDTLKIDKAMISSNCTNPKERVLLESVVMLAQRLRVNAVVEGVETAEQMGFLKTLGVNQIQGYIFSKPLTEKEYLETCRKEAGAEPEVKVHRSVKPSSIDMVMDTVFKEYPVVIMSNLSRNSFYTMSHDSFTDFNYSRSGNLTDLFDQIRTTLHPDDIVRFMDTFDIENQIERFERGDEKILFKGRIHGTDSKEYRKIETTTYFIKEKGNEDLLAVTLCTDHIVQ